MIIKLKSWCPFDIHFIQYIEPAWVDFGRYEILNYQLLSNGTYAYVQIGAWNNGNLKWIGDLQPRVSHTEIVTSVCSPPCLPGQYKVCRLRSNDHLIWSSFRHQWSSPETFQSVFAKSKSCIPNCPEMPHFPFSYLRISLKRSTHIINNKEYKIKYFY